MAARPAPSNFRSRPQAGGMAVSRYDQVSGLLVAVLIVFGFVTLMMFFVWLSSQLFAVRMAVPVTVLEEVGGGGSGQLQAGEREMEETNPEELQQLTDRP